MDNNDLLMGLIFTTRTAVPPPAKPEPTSVELQKQVEKLGAENTNLRVEMATVSADYDGILNRLGAEVLGKGQMVAALQRQLQVLEAENGHLNARTETVGRSYDRILKDFSAIVGDIQVWKHEVGSELEMARKSIALRIYEDRLNSDASKKLIQDDFAKVLYEKQAVEARAKTFEEMNASTNEHLLKLRQDFVMMTSEKEEVGARVEKLAELNISIKEQLVMLQDDLANMTDAKQENEARAEKLAELCMSTNDQLLRLQGDLARTVNDKRQVKEKAEHLAQLNASTNEQLSRLVTEMKGNYGGLSKDISTIVGDIQAWKQEMYSELDNARRNIALRIRDDRLSFDATKKLMEDDLAKITNEKKEIEERAEKLAELNTSTNDQLLRLMMEMKRMRALANIPQAHSNSNKRTGEPGEEPGEKKTKIYNDGKVIVRSDALKRH
ncbi:hypothetical protein HK101_001361 [Irineochytrium annulatum]|nr:hypothetical protein HK101_001361 [Irineochytrium annulatum]